MDSSTRKQVEDRLTAQGYENAELGSVIDKLKELMDALVASDALAKASIEHTRGMPVTVPEGGLIQLGFVLYWVKYPPPLMQEIIAELPDAVQKVWKVARWLIDTFHPPTVTESDYQYMKTQLDGAGVISPGGEILGAGTYQGADSGWLWAFFDYLINLAVPKEIASFTPSGTAEPFEEPFEGSGPIRIAVIGDWGTGEFDGGGYDPAMDVLATVKQLAPDYILHLGDVYYAGTQTRPPTGEEQRHLLAYWPEMPAKRSFTLNSNHEMYGGANGYFNVALGRGGDRTPFVHQNGYSYFVLTQGDWAFVGLDAAYYDPSSMYMDGGLGEASFDPQYAFLADIASRYSNLVLFTHQTAMSTDGTELMQLWHDVTSVVPAAQIKLWYWGHVHLGVVYGAGSAVGRLGVPARCAGHSAIPIGEAWGLGESGGVIDWFAKDPVGSSAYPNRVRNGFALLTLSDQGIKEEFYNAGNADCPAWPIPS